MNGRGWLSTFLVLVFLAVIIVLQIFSMLQSDRFYEALNRLDGLGENRISQTDIPPNTVPGGEQPADEGDWLIWCMHVEPKTLSQINVDNDIYSRWITVLNIFEPLMIYDFDEIKLRPLLAQSYEISPDGLQVTFHLRDDIHFSDGVPITADDVIFTYETIRNPKIDAANIANFYIDVNRVEKIDQRTVRFFMDRFHFKALEVLSFWDIGIYPKHIYQFDDPAQFNKRASNPVGSGPYVFESWETGRQIVLRRNENYWGPKPPLRKVAYRFITNAVASVQALRAHQVDLVIPEPEQFADLVNDAEFNRDFACVSYYSPGTPFFYIGWNQDTPYFTDRRVRLAMTHILNRDQIVSELLKDFGQVITGPFYIKGAQNDPNIRPWPYDLQKAKQLLDEAGWRDSDGDGLRDKNGTPFRFKFLYSIDNTLYQRLAKLLKDQCAKVGIEVVADPMEWSVLLPRLSDRKFEAMVMGWGGDIVEDNYQILHSSQIGNRGANYVGFRNPQADALLEQIRRTMDEQKRDELSRQLHRIFHEEQPYTFLFARPTMRLVDRRFENIKVHPLGLNYLEWYVPKNSQRYK